MNANVTVKLPDDFPYSKMKSYVGKILEVLSKLLSGNTIRKAIR